jgi:hypothetical protein
MTIFIVLSLMLMQQGRYQAYPDLIDYAKVDPTDVEYGLITGALDTLKKYGYDINEAGIIAALHDPQSSIADPGLRQSRIVLIRQAVTFLLRDTYHLKVNIRTPGTAAALQNAFHDALLDKDETAMTSMARVLPGMGKTDWITDAVAALPQMTSKHNQIDMATILAFVGHAEGWPYVRDEIASNDVNRIHAALDRIEKFDGLPNPIGGQPINVAQELHQLAATTPDNLMWPTFGPKSSKQHIKQHIEAKAAEMDKKKQQPAR